MIIKSFCWCCGQETDVYKNKNTGKIQKYCTECKHKYTLQERKEKEFKLIFNIMSEDTGDN